MSVDNWQHIAILDEIKPTAGLFAAQQWVVYRNMTELPFVTTDSPVAMFYPSGSGFWGATLPERDHYLALTPKLMLWGRPRHEGAAPFKRVSVYGTTEVERLNLQVARRAVDGVYGQDEDSLVRLGSLIKARLAARRGIVGPQGSKFV